MGLRRYFKVKVSDIEDSLYDMWDVIEMYLTSGREPVSPLEYELRARLVDCAHKIIDLLEF